MGGTDKGLQNFHGVPLALHALMRLQMQTGAALVNANRNLAAYESFGVPVWPDASQEFGGPLSGFLAGLEQCETPYLVTVPCDSPLFPLDMVERLADALERDGADMAVVQAPEVDEATGQTALRAQPVFCLMHTSLLESLVAFTQAGHRKIDRWTGQHRCANVRFEDDRAFFNANTPEDLRA